MKISIVRGAVGAVLTLLAMAVAFVATGVSVNLALKERYLSLGEPGWLAGIFPALAMVGALVVGILCLRRVVLNGISESDKGARWSLLKKSASRNYLLIVLALTIGVPWFFREGPIPDINESILAQIPNGRALVVTAKKGNDVAANELGLNLVPLGDYRAALKLFRVAAKSGLPDANYNLGLMYSQGLGVKKSEGDAAKFFMAAVAKGHMEALEALKINEWYVSQCRFNETAKMFLPPGANTDSR